MRFVLLLLALVLLFPSCGGGAAGDAKTEGDDIHIQQEATTFIVDGRAAPEGYGYYVYLVFGDNLPDTLLQRQAAASAFLGLFKNLNDVQSRGELNHARVALFVAPMRADSFSVGSADNVSGDQMVAAYDYNMGKDLKAALTRQLSRRIAPVALVGLRSALRRESDLALEEPAVVPLCGTADDVVSTFRKLQDQLLLSPHDVVSPGLVTWIRKVFESIGAMIHTVLGASARPAGCP